MILSQFPVFMVLCHIEFWSEKDMGTLEVEKQKVDFFRLELLPEGASCPLPCMPDAPFLLCSISSDQNCSNQKASMISFTSLTQSLKDSEALPNLWGKDNTIQGKYWQKIFHLKLSLVLGKGEDNFRRIDGHLTASPKVFGPNLLLRKFRSI